jgi:hypothetical protein
MMDHRAFTLDDLLPSSWDRKIVLGVVDELASLPGESYSSIEEIRRFLALKSHRELLQRLETARKNKSAYAALRSVALAIRQFGVERPALFAASFKTPASDVTDGDDAYRRIRACLVQILAECGVHGEAADQAIRILRNLTRGFVLDELLNGLLCSYPYEDTYQTAIDLFMAGLPTLVA